MKPITFTSGVPLLQGIYYFLTGVWPIFSRRTFEMVTGPKVDFWLVRTFGAVIAATGAALAVAGARGRVTAETAVLGMGSAAGLAASDLIYSSRGRISKVYAVEALAEISLVLAWLVILMKGDRFRG